MKTTHFVLLLALFSVLLFYVDPAMSGSSEMTHFGCGGPTGPSIYDDFAQCVTASGAVMYGAYWCPHCSDQKEMFESAFQYVNYVECDPRGDDANPEACNAAGIQGYPTWVFGDGTRRSGAVPLITLSATTGCQLPGQ